MHKIPRSGNAPLLIEGELLATADGSRFRGKERNRWFLLQLYRTADGYAAAIAFATRWEGECEWYAATTCRNLAQVVEWLNTTQRQPAKIGFPVGAQFEARQAALLAELDSQFAGLVTELLDADGLDWAHDQAPTDQAVLAAMGVLDAALSGENVSEDDLRAAIAVVQRAKVADILDAIGVWEEVPDAVA